MTDDGFLDDPETYDQYQENACPTCGSDVGIKSIFGWCDKGHLLMTEQFL